MQICYTGDGTKGNLGERMAKAFHDFFTGLGIKVNVFIEEECKTSEISKEDYRECFREKIKNKHLFIFLIALPTRTSEWFALEHEIARHEVKEDTKSKKDIIVINIGNVTLDSKSPLYSFDRKFDIDVIEAIKGIIKNNDALASTWEKDFNSKLLGQVLEYLYPKDDDPDSNEIISLETIASEVRKMQMKAIVSEIQYEIKKINEESDRKNEIALRDKAGEEGGERAIRDNTSLRKIQHNFMIGTISRAQDGINAVLGNEVQIRPSPVEEFWTHSIMAESNKIIATNIEEFSGSYGRQIKENLLKVQAIKTISIKKRGLAEYEGGITRIFVYNVNEILSDEKRNKLFDIMVSQFLIGIKVYAIPDWVFNKIFKRNNNNYNERDFIIINDKALYLTKKMTNGTIESTELIMPDDNLEEERRINSAKEIVTSIKEHPSTFKVEIPVIFSAGPFVGDDLDSFNTSGNNINVKNCIDDLRSSRISLVEFLSHVENIYHGNDAIVFSQYLKQKISVYNVDARVKFTWPNKFDANLKMVRNDLSEYEKNVTIRNVYRKYNGIEKFRRKTTRPIDIEDLTAIVEELALSADPEAEQVTLQTKNNDLEKLKKVMFTLPAEKSSILFVQETEPNIIENKYQVKMEKSEVDEGIISFLEKEVFKFKRILNQYSESITEMK